MRNLGVWIEIGGLQTYVGRIIGEKEEDARFSYAEEYLSGNIARPISIHLPLSENAFSVDDTRNFFEGLLPEGFTRRCVAGLLHTDANNYLSLLAGLGNECLGAIKITDENNEVVNADYQKLTIDEVSQLAREGAMETAELVTKSHLSLTGASGKVVDSLKKEDQDFSGDVDSIFEDETISEDFKKKAATIFEARLYEKVSVIEEELEEKYKIS